MKDQGNILENTSSKEKLITLLIICVILITFWYMLDLALLTFIFTYMFYSLWGLFQRRNKGILPFKIPDPIIIAVLYVIFAALLFGIGYQLIPVIMKQLNELWKIIANFNIVDLKNDLDPRIYDIVSKLNYSSYISSAGLSLADQARKIGSFGITLFISLILSLFLLLEKHKIREFGNSLENSKASSIYKYFLYFGGSFVKSFGKVMQVQVIISFVNTILSVIALGILGFPQILGLSVMIFALGLIPVVGVIVSFIPIMIIGFNIGGVAKVIEILILIIVIHFIGTYVLYPKLMSDKMNLPICFVFIVLIVGEHYLGIWGLLIGVPIFIFLLDILNITYSDDLHRTKKEKKKKDKDKDKDKYKKLEKA